MRVAHITDIHVQVPPQLSEMANKRLLGAVNLYVFGRKGHFDEVVQRALPAAVRAQAPDAILCTGDLTALATRAEFEAALRLLGPLFEACPTALIPGNHDTYVGEACEGRWIEEHFSRWTGRGDWPRLHTLGEERVVCVDACRAGLLSSGRVDADQLGRLDRMLGELDRPALVLVHYPLRGRRGQPYGPATRNLENAAEVEAVLLRHRERVAAVLCGHEHHGFRTEIDGIPQLNPGSSGYAWLPDKGRGAHFTIFEVERGRLGGVQRFAWNGEAFVPEAGGAWVSGR